MTDWDSGEFGPQVVEVQVELYTSGFRVSGRMATRFRRVADILPEDAVRGWLPPEQPA